MFVAVGRVPVTSSLGLDKTAIEVDPHGRISSGTQYTFEDVNCTSEVTLGPMPPQDRGGGHRSDRVRHGHVTDYQAI